VTLRSGSASRSSLGLVVWRRPVPPLTPSYRRWASRKEGVIISLVNSFKEHEVGFPDTEEQLELFAELIRTGRAWSLKGSYELTARHLIDAGYITLHGEITNRGRVLILDEGREGSPCDLIRALM
jgi:hypothetical protein